MSAEQQPDVTFQLHRPLPAGAPGPCGGSGLTELNASAAAAAPSPQERPNHSTTSKVAYFKRKYAEEEDLQERLHGYFQKHLILQEDRSCIVKLSLEKLRFLEDPEAYLRRSVLINNLLRKIHHEEEELEVGVEEEEEEEVKEELGEVSGEKVQHRLLFRDRTRLKVLVMDCCSPSFSLEELQRYHQLMSRCCASAQCLYMCPGLPPDPRVLLYDLDDHG